MVETKEKEILTAAIHAATAKPDFMTCDRIEALTKSHGMLNIAVMCTANAVTEDLLRGVDITLIDANTPQIPLDYVIKRAVDTAKEAGASKENAALIAATFAYFAGAASEAGMPAANRKLGALARMHADVTRGGAIFLPTFKTTHRISAYPAVKALYDAIFEGTLTKVDGRYLPPFVAGGAVYGHQALGEDINYPEIALNGGKIATEAMMNAYYGIGILPSPIFCAILGATAVMEILHPDGFVGEEYGMFGTIKTKDLAGRGAVQAAGLPEKLTVRGTDEEYETEKLVGDLAIILKDIGPSSVIGMFALAEALAIFKEGPFIGAGFSGGPVNPPSGHLMADAFISMKLLLANKGDVEKSAETLKAVKEESFLDPEYALCSLNTMARKAEQVRRGIVTETIIQASEPTKVKAVYRRAVSAYNGLSEGKSLGEVVKSLDDERKAFVESRASTMFSAIFGKDIKIEYPVLRAQSRRSDAFTAKHFGFDAYIDCKVTVDGTEIMLEDLSGKVVPDVVLNKKEEMKDPVALASAAVQELMYVGHTIINVTVPVAVAVAMGKMSPKEAAKEAAKEAYLTNAIPGPKAVARDVAKLAAKIVKELG